MSFYQGAVFELDGFSTECHKTRTKVLTLGNRKKMQIIQVNGGNWRSSLENKCEQVTIGFDLVEKVTRAF